ncbi:imelysin family protein [Stutzerimonas kirkiae]|uniref:Imelysin n=1 Tax=Stutzerimonas kirkiae TaxID=2211392 RepID=A0A4Q9RDJ7_9GAMM|nr:imelysin family protein [Stutzerimonas kirkiae]TBU99738.1 imelysin [Stutzerimonas kirkiae]TBV05330.1 imelysin [Stutzerimonas kirkiae]TBV11765.1 imelysin [Stutzerimonas kirkiae]TBV15307.1 imelysin [Stutzerimonas kirkiae]
MIRTKTLSTVLSASALGLLLTACNQADPLATTSKALADGVLLPAYSQWAEHDRVLAASASAFCAGEQALNEARGHFLQAQASWAYLQPLQTGPLSEGNRAWQVQFWPDKKNLVARQVGALLKKKPELTQADLENASVVVQGLSAYEYILFDPDIDLGKPEDKGHYCALLVAIGQHQQKLAEAILTQWQEKDGMREQLVQFPNERYAEADEAIADILRTQVTALDGLKKKLGAPMGRQSKGLPQPYQAESWRSDATLGNIRATLDGALALWQGGQDGGLKQLLGSDQQALAERIDNAYATTRQRLDALEQPFAQLLADESGREALNSLYDAINGLHRLHQGDLSSALGIQIGFNAHDGD